ncbi:probable clathrin assembly protein At4g32285 [Vicia villosa]|uniref:probable clathrin assembly protein At4g32285 n=1 Tax=Vicia villosa TaxID=3911 RepID=UPI00273B26E8|nr:probable clathrin assembly protein At4g32285 [Vicia villosa]
MKRRFYKVCTSLREQSNISYAKIASAAGFSDMNLIIIKATSPDDLPVHEKYIQYFLKLFALSPSSCHSFAISFTRRFGTTRSWRVALKSLILLHRLLRSVQGNSPLWAELLWTRSNGLISLYPCHFKDATSSSSTCSISYTNFVTSYAQLLDEALNCVALDSKKLDNQKYHEEENDTFREKMNEMGEILEILPQLQSIIDRVIDCYPIGVATRSFIVQSAMKHIIRDSFVCYTKFRAEIVVVLENLFEMSYRNCIAAFNIYKKSAVQTNKLCEFYEWCKAKGLCGYYEYPFLEPIPGIQIKALESFLSGMWQLTESSSSSMSDQESSSIFTEDDGRQQIEMIKGNEEEKPLIDLGEYEDDDVSWETVLESSVSFCHAYHQNDSLGSNSFDGMWETATYKSPAAASNPFNQESYESNYYGRFAHNPVYPWGL